VTVIRSTQSTAGLEVHMSSKVRAAIEAAIAADKKRAKEKRGYSRRALQVVKGQSNPKDALAMLKRLGFDFREIARHGKEVDARIVRELRRLHNKDKKPAKIKLSPAIYTLAPPPLDDTPQFPFCIFPAASCDSSGNGPSTIIDCNAATAVMNLVHSSGGVGGPLGVEAYPEQAPVSATLFYGVNPPIGGTLAVIAEVIVSGSMEVHSTSGVSAFDYFSLARASARATIVVSTDQQGGAGSQFESQTIGDIHCDHGGSASRQWVDDLFVVVLYAQVLPGIPVTIKVTLQLDGIGVSDFGHANFTLNKFRRGVRVAALCLNLTPTAIL
jgi:hypothetical protein